MEKYFTPDIEDIRVGYECEFKHTGTWITSKLNRTNEVSHIYSLYREPKMDGIPVRVPFLTKEQIQAEGWIGSNQNFDVEGFHKNNFFASYNFQTKMLGIIVKDPSKTEWLEVNTPKYVGKCKDINTFRYICKLLTII